MEEYESIRGKRALIAMSGGVDSSVAAKLMVDAGAECIGCTMKLFDVNTAYPDPEVRENATCCSADDAADARAVATRLNMPFYVFNFQEDFDREVICRFVNSYMAGSTPNPCIECNRYLKFSKLLHRAKELGCDLLVTGHYARTAFSEGRWHLYRASDPTKDQSYVLYSLTQEQLQHIRFPLGSLDKPHVREIAQKNGFVNAAKPDSQDICFVPDGDYAGVIRHRTGKEDIPGDFVDLSGRVMGRHKGITHYTIGQRRGLGLAVPESVYVCRICPETNTVVLGHNEDLFTRDVRVTNFNWIQGSAPDAPFTCDAKIRYRQSALPACITPVSENEIHIEFKEPVRAVTPGQAAVLYLGDEVLGGGEIIRN